MILMSSYYRLIKLTMSDRKAMQLSQNKKHSQPQEEPSRQSHSSLDKIEKKVYAGSTLIPYSELSNTFKQKKTNGLVFKGTH